MQISDANGNIIINVAQCVSQCGSKAISLFRWDLHGSITISEIIVCMYLGASAAINLCVSVRSG